MGSVNPRRVFRSFSLLFLLFLAVFIFSIFNLLGGACETLARVLPPHPTIRSTVTIANCVIIIDNFLTIASIENLLADFENA